MPASWSTVGDSERGNWPPGDVCEPGLDEGAVGEPAQPVASSATTTTLTSDEDLFITAKVPTDRKAAHPRPLLPRSCLSRNTDWTIDVSKPRPSLASRERPWVGRHYFSLYPLPINLDDERPDWRVSA